MKQKTAVERVVHLVKTLSAFTADITRPAPMAGILVEHRGDNLGFVVTDGYVCLSVTSDVLVADVPLGVGSYTPRPLIAKLVADVAPCDIAPQHLPATFPDWRQIVPRAHDKGLTSFVNAAFLSTVCAAVSVCISGKKNERVLLSPPAENWHPFMLSCSNGSVSVEAAVMPMRGDGP